MTSRIGWMGSLLIIAALLAAVLYGAWRYALATNAVALLDWGDRQFGGTEGYTVALSDARYGADPAHRIEVIVPDRPSAAPRPVLVFFHGGGWHAGQPGDYHFVGRTFARAGYVVVLAGYRLVPEGRYPAMLEDGAAALAWTRDHAATHGGDPARVAIMGHSAGAYIAAMLGLERQWLGRAGVEDGFIKGVVGLSGPYDFFPWTSDSARNAFGHTADPPLTQPITYVRGDAPPMLLLTGDSDTTVRPRNSRALARALSDAGTPTEPVILTEVDHSGTAMKLAAPFSRDRRVLDPVLAFLAARTLPSAPVQAPDS
jgi:acetyl esterase/lipase